MAQPRQFTINQCKRFKRSVVDLARKLQGKFGEAEPKLTNFKKLLDVVGHIELGLEQFSENLTNTLLCIAKTTNRETLDLIQQVLFGVIDWKKRTAGLGTADYWKEKKRQDKNANQPVYFDVANIDHNHKPVAHLDTSKAINRVMESMESIMEVQVDDGVDAFGSRGPLVDKYPAPKNAKLGDVKLFSVNTSKPPRPKGGALTTPTPKIFCYPMKQLAHIRSKVTPQNPFPVLRCPYQRILAIIDCVTGPSESHRMPPESICVSVV